MQSLEAACEQAEQLLQHTKIKANVLSVVNDKSEAQFISINQKLRDLYEEECAKDTTKPNKPTRSPSRLLSKLVAREGLSTLLVRLYPGERGYCVALGGSGASSKKGSTTATATATAASAAAGTGSAVVSGAGGVVLPYEQDDLLRYIDREELPPGLGELLERSTSPLYYGGCVVAEVHDMRHCPSGHTRFVLLRPSNQSLLCDINMITRDGDWTPEERVALESQLLQATQGPLCLDPSPSVSMSASRVRHQGLQLSSAPLRRVARKFSQVSINRKRKLDQYASQCSTPLLDFIEQRKPKTRYVPTIASAKLMSKPSEGIAGLVESLPNAPDVSDVVRLARAYDLPRHTSDCTPQLVEEYVLETERAQGRVYHIRLSLLQRPSSTESLGELYVDRDYREGVHNGASCRFPLGTRAHALRYIQQFTEIFTEEGRKSVRITHLVPGQPNRVTFTGSLRERDTHKVIPQPAPTNISVAASSNLAVNIAVTANVSQIATQTAPVIMGATVSSTSLPTNSSSINTNGLPNITPQQQNILPVLSPQIPQQTHLTNSVLMAQQQLQQLQQQQQQLLHQHQQQSPLPATQVVQANINTSPVPVSPIKPCASSPTRHTTNPAISALVTSLMNSAQQFQQAAAMNNSVASAATPANLNTPLIQQPTQSPKASGRKISSNNLIGSRMSSPLQTVPIAPLPPQLAPSVPPPILPQPQQTVRMSALTSQLNAPPVIAPAQACFPNNSLPVATNFSYTVPNKMVTSNHTGRISHLPNVQNDVNSGNRRQNNSIIEQLPSNLGLSMPGLSALLAGTPSADNPIPGANTSSTLLERLTASSGTPTYVPSPSPTSVPSSTPSPKPITPSPMSSPSHQTATLSVSNLNLSLASLQGAMASIPGLQNVQVSIPGLSSPISLSLNVSNPVTPQTGVIVTTLPLGNTSTATCTSGLNTVVSNLAPVPSPTSIAPLAPASNHTMLLANSVGMAPNTGQVLSLPVAQVMTPGMKSALNQAHGLRTATSNSVTLPQLAPNLHQQQSIQLVGTLRGAPGQMVTPVTARGLAQRNKAVATALKLPANAQVASTGIPTAMANPSNQVMALTAQQQLQLALQKHPTLQLQQCLTQQQKTTMTGASLNSKHRRRSSTAEPK